MDETPRYGCGGCPSRWWGAAICHCAACHTTFSGVTGFDEHRQGGSCLSAGQLARRGLHEVRPGVWGRPVKKTA